MNIVCIVLQGLARAGVHLTLDGERLQAYWAADRERYVAALRDWRLAVWRAVSRHLEASCVGAGVPAVAQGQSPNSTGGE